MGRLEENIKINDVTSVYPGLGTTGNFHFRVGKGRYDKDLFMGGNYVIILIILCLMLIFSSNFLLHSGELAEIVKCRNMDTSETLSDTECDSSKKPASSTQECNTQQCENYHWVKKSPGCSVTCGAGR